MLLRAVWQISDGSRPENQPQSHVVFCIVPFFVGGRGVCGGGGGEICEKKMKAG